MTTFAKIIVKLMATCGIIMLLCISMCFRKNQSLWEDRVDYAFRAGLGLCIILVWVPQWWKP